MHPKDAHPVYPPLELKVLNVNVPEPSVPSLEVKVPF